MVTAVTISHTMSHDGHPQESTTKLHRTQKHTHTIFAKPTWRQTLNSLQLTDCVIFTGATTVLFRHRMSSDTHTRTLTRSSMQAHWTDHCFSKHVLRGRTWCAGFLVFFAVLTLVFIYVCSTTAFILCMLTGVVTFTNGCLPCFLNEQPQQSTAQTKQMPSHRYWIVRLDRQHSSIHKPWILFSTTTIDRVSTIFRTTATIAISTTPWLRIVSNAYPGNFWTSTLLEASTTPRCLGNYGTVVLHGNTRSTDSWHAENARFVSVQTETLDSDSWLISKLHRNSYDRLF